LTCILLIITLLLTSPGFSQTPLTAEQADTTIYKVFDKPAEFPGGIDSLFKFIRHNYRYTCMDGDDFSGTIYAEFIIEKDGRTSHAKIIKHLSANCDNEVLRVISIMPLWKAAQLNGRAVRTRYVVPVKFRLR
jgi:protein TonB